jgi:hypothetical protein
MTEYSKRYVKPHPEIKLLELSYHKKLSTSNKKTSLSVENSINNITRWSLKLQKSHSEVFDKDFRK